MVLFDHFTELRIRISYIFLSLLITFLTSSFFSLELIYLFVKPFLGLNKGFIFTDLTEALYTTLKICLIISFFFFLLLYFINFGAFLHLAFIPLKNKKLKNYIFLFSLVFFLVFFLNIFVFYLLFFSFCYNTKLNLL